eukprot:gene18054-24476_t
MSRVTCSGTKHGQPVTCHLLRHKARPACHVSHAQARSTASLSRFTFTYQATCMAARLAHNTSQSDVNHMHGSQAGEQSSQRDVMGSQAGVGSLQDQGVHGQAGTSSGTIQGQPVTRSYMKPLQGSQAGNSSPNAKPCHPPNVMLWRARLAWLLCKTKVLMARLARAQAQFRASLSRADK